MWGHKHVPAPSSHLLQKLTAAPGARNPAQDKIIPKSAQTARHQTQCLRSCCQLCPDTGQHLGLVSLWKAFWTKLAGRFTAAWLSDAFSTKRKQNEWPIRVSTNFRFRLCSSSEPEARSETLGWGCSVNPQIDPFRWKLESPFSSTMWLELHHTCTLVREESS